MDFKKSLADRKDYVTLTGTAKIRMAKIIK